jgi:hypothetical protein
MNQRAFLHPLLILAALAGSGTPALAQNKGGSGSSSGLITIDQAKAEAGGITAGDAPGFPVTISQPGSYRLMGNLTVADPTVTAIRITHPDVTLDLNGFTVKGPNLCTGYAGTLTCSVDGMAGTRGHGIDVAIDGALFGAHVQVGNGTVAGFAGNGIVGGSVPPMPYRPVDVHRVRVHSNGFHGVTNAASVTESSISRNRSFGLAFVARAVGNTVIGNRVTGIGNSHGRFNHVASNGLNFDAYTLLD